MSVLPALRVARLPAFDVIPGLVHGFALRSHASTSRGRDQARVEAHEALSSYGSACFLRQVHGTRVAQAPWLEPPEADAAVTTADGCLLCIETADCLPLLLVDPVSRVVAVAHAGWRGTAAGIARLTLEAMVEAGADAARIIAALGPCIGVCCYEVGRDVIASFDGGAQPVFREGRGGRAHLDLRASNQRQLEHGGLRPERITHLGDCTFCHAERYPSYRRDGVGCGRMISFVGWRSSV
jgi:YfiH family protein